MTYVDTKASLDVISMCKKRKKNVKEEAVRV